MRNTWSIRKNLVLLVLAATLPLGFLLVYGLQENYRLALREAQRSSLRTCEMVSADARRFVVNVQELLSGLAARPMVRALDPNRCDPLLAEFRSLYPRYANLAITDADGYLICSALPAPAGKRAGVGASQWFAEAKKSNRFSAGSAHLGPVSGKKVAVLAQPIQDAQGKFAGLIGYSLDLQMFDPMPKEVELPAGMLLSILDGSGNVIARSDGNKDAIGRAFHDREALTLALQGASGVGLVGAGEQERLVSYAAISGTSWLVVGVQPSHKVLSGLSLLANQKYLFAFLLILLGAGSAYWVGRLITKPIEEIAGVADSIAEGDYQRRAVCHGPREIAVVAQRINQMLDVQHQNQIELRAKNAALEQSEQEVRAIMENAPAVIFVKDTSGRYVHVNRQFELLEHMDLSEIVGKTDHELFPPEVADHLAGNDQVVLESGAPIKVEEQVPRKDSMRSYIVVKFPLKRAEDGIYAICGIATDVTDIKRAEEERMLLEKQFQQSQKLESLGVLAGGIAHDFNNILAVIAGHCSLARIQPDALEKHIPPIEKAVERAAELCRQMLAYAGKAQFVRGRVNIPLLVDEMVQMLSATISKNVAIGLEVAPEIPPVEGDAGQLRQIVMNLIINASEAIGEAQGEIRIGIAAALVVPGLEQKNHLGQPMEPGNYVRIEVSDTGCGMDAETQKRIFEPFYTTKFTGRGLGMSAVLGILKAHGGALQLESRPGEGTTFRIYLPVDGALAPEQEAPPSSGAGGGWIGGGTVLLVEDEPQLLAAAREMLRALGFRVLEATNGKEALRQFREHGAKIDVALTDLGMPLMGGEELIREIRKAAPRLPIVVASGFGNGVVASRLSGVEVAGFVGKPYNLEQLREVLKRVIEARRVAGGHQAP